MKAKDIFKQVQKLSKDKRVKQAQNFLVEHKDEIGKVASKALGSKGKKGIVKTISKLLGK